MAFTPPASPVTNQIYSAASGQNWIWNGTQWIPYNPPLGFAPITAATAINAGSASATYNGPFVISTVSPYLILPVARGGTGTATSTGTGSLVLNTSPTITTPTITTPTITTPTITGGTITTPTITTPTITGGSINNTTIGATTASTGAFTTLSANSTTSFTGSVTLAGTASVLAAILTDVAETTTISATAATGTIALYPSTQSVLYYTTAASANWTVNLTFSSGTTLNTAMSTGQSLTVAFLVTQGATAYYNNVVQVDGATSGVTTIWQGGAPTAGNASGTDVYTYTIIKTASATFTVLASLTQFK